VNTAREMKYLGPMMIKFLMNVGRNFRIKSKRIDDII
jgi:hypothetical protein